MVLRLIVILSLINFIACDASKTITTSKIQEAVADVNQYKEEHRPQFHFSPPQMWMNDPNGMVYFDGEYHLFYQHYPDGNKWGPMHWGHAVSTDLVHWENLPIALYPDEHGLIFSGSAVVDWQNTSGFGINGVPPLIAIYSYHDMEKERAGIEDDFQTQGIAYSNDRGRSWTKYLDNPVIANPGVRDFRDPKVIWHEPTSKWVMAVSALDHLKFYGSGNLKEWTLLSEFGKDIGSHDGVWECPDLFPMLDDNGVERWVLIENMNPGNPNGGSGTQYFIGQFDGSSFSVDPDFMSLLETKTAYSPQGLVFEDFESGYLDWEKEGNAFSDAASKGGLGNQQESWGYYGEGLANSFMNGNEATGSLTSIEFVIVSNAINFLIGGGNHRGRTYIGLEVDGKMVRIKEGRSRGLMEWNGWDVSAFRGQTAKIKIVDDYKKNWGYINIDQITFADAVATPQQTGSVWLDSGRDNYAGVTWSDVPSSDGRRIFLGWMSNWTYAQDVPTYKWRSAMTIPWNLSIKTYNGIPRLVGYPVNELSVLRKGQAQLISSYAPVKFNSKIQVDLNIKAKLSAVGNIGFKLSNDLGEYVSFSVNAETQKLSFDRTKSGKSEFSKDFPGTPTAVRIDMSDNLDIRALIDVSSVEIFVDGGANIFTEIFFPTQPYNTLELLSDSGVVTASIHELDGIWQ